MDVKRLARCFELKEFRAFFRYTNSKATLLAYPSIVQKCTDELLLYGNILVAATYRWVENVFSALDAYSLMEAAGPIMDFFKHLNGRFRSGQLDKVLRFTIESYITTHGIGFLEQVATKKVEYKFCARVIE